MPSQRYKLILAYRGTRYHGWQAQPAAAGADGEETAAVAVPTVQETVAKILEGIVLHPVNLVGSSRTDAGVHAKGQVAHFDTDQLQIPREGIRKAANHRLPGDIFIHQIEAVNENFDAILCTERKRYQYAIFNSHDRPVFQNDLMWHRWQRLDLDAMREAASRLVGTHDFASFARPGHNRENTVRTIFGCDVSAIGPRVVIGVEGSGFLWNMVRIIVGTLVQVGVRQFQPEQIEQMLAARDRQSAGPTAPPHGLYLQWIRMRPENEWRRSSDAFAVTARAGDPPAGPGAA